MLVKYRVVFHPDALVDIEDAAGWYQERQSGLGNAFSKANLLLDTLVLLWAASEPERLSRRPRALLLDPANQLVFSSVSLWEQRV